MKASRRRTYGPAEPTVDLESGVAEPISEQPAATAPTAKKKVAGKKKVKKAKVEMADRSASKEKATDGLAGTVLLRLGVPLSVRARLGRLLRPIPSRRRVICMAGLFISLLAVALAVSLLPSTVGTRSAVAESVDSFVARVGESIHLTHPSEVSSTGLNAEEQAATEQHDNNTTDTSDRPPLAPGQEADPPTGEGAAPPASSGTEEAREEPKTDGSVSAAAQQAEQPPQPPPLPPPVHEQLPPPSHEQLAPSTHDQVAPVHESLGSVPAFPPINSPRDGLPSIQAAAASLGASASVNGIPVSSPEGLPLDPSSDFLAHARNQVHVPQFKNVLEYWVHDTLPDTPICRLHSACIAGNGAVLLPEALSRHSTMLESCGIRNPVFALPSEGSSIQDLPSQIGSYTIDKSGSSADLLVRGSIRDTFEPQLPQFVTSVLATLLAAETAFGHPDSLNKYECINATRSCRGKVTYDNIFPAVLISAAVARARMASETWEGEVLTSLKASADLSLSFIEQERLFGPESENKATCFHTVVSTMADGFTMPASLLDADESHQIMKETALLSAPSVVGHLKPRNVEPMKCPITFTVVNKQKARELKNAYKLKVTLLEQAGPAIQAAVPGVDVKVVAQIVPYETSTFPKLVAALRATDVMIGPYSEGMANALFMRPRTTVIEVFPFAYVTPLYENLCQMRNIKHLSVISEPQTKTFKLCLQRSQAAMSDREALQGLLEKWDAASLAYKEGRGLHELKLEVPGTSTVDDAINCALEQVLEFDVDELVKRAIEEGIARCKSNSG